MIIDELGPEHVRTGKPIVYTSADSVFQIAAHEATIPVPELYRICEIAYELAGEGMGVGRVIARPFVGDAGSVYANGEPSRLRAAAEQAPPFWMRLTASRHCGPRDRENRGSVRRPRDYDGGPHARTTIRAWTRSRRRSPRPVRGSCSPTWSTSTRQYGHRNDVAGYAANLERFDARLSRLLPRLRTRDLLIVTADHGNDPTTPSTDHAREYVPLFLVGAAVRPGTDSGVTFESSSRSRRRRGTSPSRTGPLCWAN